MTPVTDLTKCPEVSNFSFFLLFVFKATSRETRVSDVTLTVPDVQASLLFSSFFLPNYHVLHSVADVDVTFQKCNRENRLSASSTERTFFLTFPRAPPRFPPLPAYVASTENALDCTISFFYLPFPFYFYFTHVYVHTHTHTLHALWTISRYTDCYFLTENRPSSSVLPLTRTISFFPSYFDSTREETTIQKYKKKKKETESGAPFALNATECSLSLCHVDRFKWLSDKSSRRLVQMYLWRRTKAKERKKEIRTI